MDTSDHVDYMFKLIIIGSAGVGKSQIMQQYAVGKFCENSKSTIGVDFYHKQMTIDDKKIEVQVWDTAGQEKYRAIMPKFYYGTHGTFLVYSIVDRQSFEEVVDWIDEVNQHTRCLFFVLVGNKCDLEFERSVTQEEGEKFAKSHNLVFMETSAKEGKNINKAFETLIQGIYETIYSQSDLGENEGKIESNVPHGIILSPNTSEHSSKSVKNKCEC